MIINFKKPIGFIALYFIIKIIKLIFIFIFPYFYLSLSGTTQWISNTFIDLLIFSLLYSLYFKVKLSEQFKRLSSSYLTGGLFIGYFLGELLLFILKKPSHLMRIWQGITAAPSAPFTGPLPAGIAIIALISLFIIAVALLFIINYFLIFWGNKLALWILKNKKVTEI